jgi:PKD domain
VKKLAILAVAVAMVAAGIGFSTKGASAAPIVNTGGPYAAAVGQPIQFNGSFSNGVGIVSFFWTFGDGSSATGAFPVKSYAAPGVYTVSLTVTDATGSSTALTTATISGFVPVQPTIAAGCVNTSFGVICQPSNQVTTVFSQNCVLTIFGLACSRVPFVTGQVVVNTGVVRETRGGGPVCIPNDPRFFINGLPIC